MGIGYVKHKNTPNWVYNWKQTLSSNQRGYINTLEEKYQEKCRELGELTQHYNNQVSCMQNTFTLLAHQCNILRTTITGKYVEDNPFESMSEALIPPELHDMWFIREGICIYANKLFADKVSPEDALQAWMGFLTGESSKGLAKKPSITVVK